MLNFNNSACFDGDVLSFTVVAACLPMMVLNSDSTHFSPPICIKLLLLMGNVVECVCFLGVVGGRKKKLKKQKAVGLENYTALAINFFKLLKKSR